MSYIGNYCLNFYNYFLNSIAVALTKQAHTVTFADQLSRNITLALTTQEIVDKKLNDKVDALEEAVMAMGQEIVSLKVKLALRCHMDFKWICVTPLQVNTSRYTWDKIKNHLEGVWNHSDLGLDISKLHQEILDMNQGEQAFGAQNRASDLFSNTDSFVGHKSLSSMLINLAVSALLLILLLLSFPVLFKLNG